MPSTVKLYVYDLSNGLARQLSRQLTGKQIDGIWHTSVVVFGKEVFYGQGIIITPPGRSHHGQPLQIIDLGETGVDEATFDEYIDQMRDHYTAEKYHLLDFNCNSFTNDAAGFLTGAAIPAWIRDLPTEFLSTPFGASLRPTIDNMYRRPLPGAVPPAAPTSASALASSILNDVATRAQRPNTSAPSPPMTNGAKTVAAPLTIATNLASLHSTLTSHRCAVAFFTSATCGPCRVIAPVFESHAHDRNKTAHRMAFVKIDLGVSASGDVARAYDVTETPTFIFFFDEKVVHILRGADTRELETQIDLLLFQAYPPHSHSHVNMLHFDKIPVQPILQTNLPPLETIINKLTISLPESPSAQVTTAMTTLRTSFNEFLQSRFGKTASIAVSVKEDDVRRWSDATLTLISVIQDRENVFPLIDLWRVAILDRRVAATQSCRKAVLSLLFSVPSPTSPSRAVTLTSLRLLSNALGDTAFAISFLLSSTSREQVMASLVSALLRDETDETVRQAAASAAFNLGVLVQLHRRQRLMPNNQRDALDALDGDENWQVELTSALLHSISCSNASETIHRLTAALAFVLVLSPAWEGHLQMLCEVMGAVETLRKGSEIVTIAKQVEVKGLIDEVIRLLSY